MGWVVVGKQETLTLIQNSAQLLLIPVEQMWANYSF